MKKYKPFMEGKRVCLREIRPSDVNQIYYRWMNDGEVTRFLESRFSPNSMAKLKSYAAKILQDPKYIFFAILEKKTGRHIGNVKLGPINWVHRFGDIGIMIGDKASHGKGYGTEAIRLVSQFAFETLNLHKVTASCYGNNVGSIRIFEKADFFEEGRRGKQYFSDGEYVDLVCFGMINPRDNHAGKES